MLNQSCIAEINPNSKRMSFWVAHTFLIINLVLACHLVTLLCPHDSMLSKHSNKGLPWFHSTCSSADRLAHVPACWLSHFHSSEAIAQSSLPTCPKILQTSPWPCLVFSPASIWNHIHNPTHETVSVFRGKELQDKDLGCFYLMLYLEQHLPHGKHTSHILAEWMNAPCHLQQKPTQQTQAGKL